MLQGYRVGRETVWRHLGRVIARTRDGKQTSWLSDPELYAHIRSLYQTRRVRIMQGDLSGAKSIATVAKACEELDVTLRVLYMSNAEEYFKYGKSFRESITALPTDDKSVLLRTIYSKKWEHADLWAYQVQPLSDFKARLAERKYGSRNPMLRYAKADKSLETDLGIKGFSRIGYQDRADAPKAPAAE